MCDEKIGSGFARNNDDSTSPAAMTPKKRAATTTAPGANRRAADFSMPLADFSMPISSRCLGKSPSRKLPLTLFSVHGLPRMFTNHLLGRVALLLACK
jgi:hypothetical protein